MSLLRLKSVSERLKASVRDIPDFPKPGVVFKDITPVLANGQLFRLAISIFNERYYNKSLSKIMAVDARGFILGAALAHHLGIGFVPVRKKGKLPFEAFSVDYDLEYGVDTLQLHVDAVEKGERILVIDDVLATGGTAAAAAQLAQMAGAQVVEIGFLIEIKALEGRKKLSGFSVFSALEL